MIIDQETSTTEQICQRADEAIADLERQRTEVIARIRQTQDELATLTKGHETRFQGLLQARALFEQHEAQYEDMGGYLKLVQGTPREEQALKSLVDAKKHLAEEKKALQKRERETTEADKQDKAHEQELTTVLQGLFTEQERIQLEIQSVQKAKEHAHTQEGLEIYHKYLPLCKEKLALVEALSEQLIAAKLSALEAHREALEDLENWPTWRRSIAQLRPADDATVRVLRANISYLELLEQDAEQVASPFLPSLQRGFSSESLHSQLLLGDKIAAIRQAAQSLAMSDYQTDLQSSQLSQKRLDLRSQRQLLERLLAEYLSYREGRTGA